MKHTYEIMMSNKDRLYYKTDMEFKDFKEWLSTQEWITIHRNNNWVRDGEWSSYKPSEAQYKVSNIIYIEWDEEFEKREIKRREQVFLQSFKRLQILRHKHNWRFKLWIRCKYFLYGGYGYFMDNIENSTGLYGEEWIEEVLNKLKYYKCKLK